MGRGGGETAKPFVTGLEKIKKKKTLVFPATGLADTNQHGTGELFT